MAAFKEHVVRHEFAAAVHHHLHRVVAAVGNGAQEVGVVETEPVLHAVGDEEFFAVFDALRLLHGVHRAGDVAAADGGVAADDTHFFEHQHLETGAAGLKGTGHARKARTDDDDVEGFVVILDGGGRNTGVCGSRSHDGGGGNGGTL